MAPFFGVESSRMCKEDPFLSPLGSPLCSEKGGIGIAVSRGDGLCFPFASPLSGDFGETYSLLKRSLLALLWMVGGNEISLSCPKELYARLLERISIDSELENSFEAMEEIYGGKVAFSLVDELPRRKIEGRTCSLSSSGCRIGLDLGGSDIKAIALKEGEVAYSAERLWDPRNEKDPSYHEGVIASCLKEASSFLPKVDFVGVSTSGIVERGEILFPSLFASCSEGDRKGRVRTLFNRLIPSLLPGTPFRLINDGDASSLGGALLHHKDSLLGLSLGTSLAAGYVKEGRLYPYLNELSKVSVNLSPKARSHYKYLIKGSASEYLSQKGLLCLAESHGIELEGSLPERLLALQKLADSKDIGVLQVYEEFGRRLADSVIYFSAFLDFSTVFLLGRVMSGKGGEAILKSASSRMEEKGKGLAFFTAGERFKRLGQAYVASLLSFD